MIPQLSHLISIYYVVIYSPSPSPIMQESAKYILDFVKPSNKYPDFLFKRSFSALIADIDNPSECFCACCGAPTPMEAFSVDEYRVCSVCAKYMVDENLRKDRTRATGFCPRIVTFVSDIDIITSRQHLEEV
jgi:hypothetical protein